MKCKAAMINLSKIRAAWKFLTRKTCTKMVTSLFISHLDYTNSLLVGLPQVSLNQLQRVQHMAAKIALNKSKYDRPTRCHRQAPSYLENLITIKWSRREGMTPEKQTRILDILHTSKKTFVAKSFSVKGPEYWN